MTEEPVKPAPHTLSIRDFAQIAEADIALGDLTVLVGAQGTGKSLALQWLKVALDGHHVVRALKDAGHDVKQTRTLIDLIFGVGMGAAWRDESSITFDGAKVDPAALKKGRAEAERLFFIPAHRSMLISDGWASPFQKLPADVPVVARMFSQNLFDRFTARSAGPLFPVTRKLKQAYRARIEEAVFHGGSVSLEQDAQHAKRLKLVHDKAQLPFMTWTAGQREFTPLLLGLYHLLPSTKQAKQPGVDWVVIEEPEMGLHPEAINVVLLLVFDLLWRGYRVVLSTHSPHVLTAIWMLERLGRSADGWRLLCKAFGLGTSASLRSVAEAVLQKDYRVHLLGFGKDRKVHSTDISSLDPDAPSAAEAEWGGLTGYSSRFGDAVREAVNRSEG
jgi:hypothetical protein